MSNKFYETLWVDKSSSADEIKKAYRKQAMKYHPDRNQGDKTAESKFKDINNAYDTLSDPQKRQQYDTFGSAGWAAGGNPFGWGWSGWFEDMFSWFGWGRQQQSQSESFNFEDLFWGGGFWGTWGQQQSSRRSEPKQEPVSLDFEKTYEVPIFDMILGCKIEVKWVYGQTAKLKIPANTKPWTKFRVKEFWKSEGSKKWNLLVKIDAKMPKNISEVDLHMLSSIRDNIGY